VSGALAFAAGTHSDQRFTSVFVTARTASRCMCAGMGLASLPRFQSCAYLVSPGLQPTFIPWQRRFCPRPVQAPLDLPDLLPLASCL
jgi:hypothetical protein